LIIGGAVAGVLVVAAIIWSLFRAKPNHVVTIESSEKSTEEDKEPGWYGWPKDAPPPAIAPFDADAAKMHQQAWAEYLQVPVEFTNKVGMKFRMIPPGEFLMGATQAEQTAAVKAIGDEPYWTQSIPSEGPQHGVILKKPFYLGVFEVTQREFDVVTGKTPSYF